MAEENTQNTQDSFDEFVARHQAAQRDEDVRRDQDAQWASADKRQNGLATWALSLGIVAALMGMSLVLTAFAWIPALIGLVLGIMAVVKARKITGDGRRMGMSVAAHPLGPGAGVHRCSLRGGRHRRVAKPGASRLRPASRWRRAGRLPA